MILYHGSKREVASIKKSQAQSIVEVPKDELLDAVYLTSDLGFAVAMAARPRGLTRIDNNKITFEHPELFNPEQEIFVYEFDTSKLEGNLRQIDDKQWTLEGVNEVQPENTHRFKAREILKYYELVNWGEEREIGKDIKVK